MQDILIDDRTKYQQVIKDMLHNNCFNIEKLKIEICFANLEFLQCLQQSQVLQFYNLRQFDICRGCYGDVTPMKTDLILNEIFKRAPNLQYLSFPIQSDDFVNDNLQFKFNDNNNNNNNSNINFNKNNHSLECVKIFLDSSSRYKQLKNVTRLLNSHGHEKGGSITKKLLLVSGWTKPVVTILKLLRSRLCMDMDVSTVDHDHDHNHNYNRDRAARLVNLKELEVQVSRDHVHPNMRYTTTNANDIIDLLDEFNETTKTHKTFKINGVIEHYTQISRSPSTQEKHVEEKGSEGFYFNHYDNCFNAPSFSQFSKICNLMQEINLNGNLNNNNNNNNNNNGIMNDQLQLKFMFIDGIATSKSDTNNIGIWGLPSKRVFAEMGFIHENKNKNKNSKLQKKSETQPASLTFEECVKKFNKHKVGIYCDKYDDNTDSDNNGDMYYRACFIMVSYPSSQTIVLRFFDSNEKDGLNKFIAIKKDEFPTKKIEFDIERYNVNASFLSLGLEATFHKYKENEDPVDQGCQFYYNSFFVTSTKQFKQILRGEDLGRKYGDAKYEKWLKLFSDAHGCWLPPENLNAVNICVNSKEAGFASIVVTS